MSRFKEWARRHLADENPTPEPASPPQPFDADEEDFAATGEVPVIPFREDVPSTPIYDQIREEALAADGFANQVEADLKELTERNAR